MNKMHLYYANGEVRVVEAKSVAEAMQLKAAGHREWGGPDHVLVNEYQTLYYRAGRWEQYGSLVMGWQDFVAQEPQWFINTMARCNDLTVLLEDTNSLVITHSKPVEHEPAPPFNALAIYYQTTYFDFNEQQQILKDIIDFFPHPEGQVECFEMACSYLNKREENRQLFIAENTV